MRTLMLLGSAALLCLAPGAFAQATPDAAANQRPAVQINNEVTMTGCIVRESDYRKMRSDGRGGVLGSGVGVGDEFVLANATASTAGGRRGDARGDRVAARPIEDRGRAGGGGRNYTLTGPLEKNLVSDIGRLVQVVGKVEVVNPDATPESPVEDLPRITITVAHAVGDFCPATK